MTITLKTYNRNGSLRATAFYSTPKQAFDAMLAAGLEALAHPTGTTSGAYNYDPRKSGHTLEGFERKLACCCNSPAEYYRRMEDAGIVARVSI